MLMKYFDPGGPQVTHDILVHYMQWWYGYSQNPNRQGAGMQFYYAENDFLRRFRSFLSVYWGQPMPNAGELNEAYMFPWNGAPAMLWKTLPDFITSSFTQPEKTAYARLINGPNLTLDDAGKIAISLFERAMIIYNDWLLSTNQGNDNGVLTSYKTRIKSTHYWTLQLVFLAMIEKWIPPSRPLTSFEEYISRYRKPFYGEIPFYGYNDSASTNWWSKEAAEKKPASKKSKILN